VAAMPGGGDTGNPAAFTTATVPLDTAGDRAATADRMAGSLFAS
jgi:hypothetical protein